MPVGLFLSKNPPKKEIKYAFRVHTTYTTAHIAAVTAQTDQTVFESYSIAFTNVLGNL